MTPEERRKERAEYIRGWYAGRKELRQQYRKTPEGVAKNMYVKMRARIRDRKTYKGKGISITQKQFLSWILKNEDYHRIYNEWVAKNFENRLRPSIDRLDNDRGYHLGNIRILPFHENCRLGSTDSWQKRKKIMARRVSNQKYESVPRGSKLTELQVIKVLDAIRRGAAIKEIATRFNISASNLYAIKTRRTWKHIPCTCSEKSGGL